MKYLYGDSTESDLESNFLELLRDAIDFGVFVLRADESIKAGKAQIAALSEEATAELARLEGFTAGVARAIEAGDKGADVSPTAMCASQLVELLARTKNATADAVRAKLAADIAAIEAEESASRTACHEALQTFLDPHGKDDARETRRVALLDGGTYDATAMAQATFGIDWLFALHVPPESLWASPVRLERLAPHIELHAPQVTGWLTKEVKVKPQRLERHTATELTLERLSGGAASRTFLKLRIEATVETGFDVEVLGAEIRMTRVGPVEDASVGPFQIEETDVTTVRSIVDKLTAATAELANARLVDATFDGLPFKNAPSFVPIAVRLVERLAPVVREISARSLTPTELVLRRALTDDRREEFFVTKATLREKYEVLPPALRSLFQPLGFDVAPVDSQPPPASLKTDRKEIRASQPSVPPPPLPPPVPRASSIPPPSSLSGKNEAFVEAVKKIMIVLKSGRTDEGYAQYADLLSSDGFAEYRSDDQRQALKLLLLAKAPDRTEAVARAYRIALKRIQALVDAHAEPADYEMLGVAHVQLDDRTAASAAFEIALKLERARNPSSDLCTSLGRRISALG
ncbi:MAG TPA: hypothetical protein VH054_30430 [Polyangiaceae bacterium]|nr:hypothetical protein [Polyangiaceae bacterium]